MHVFRIEVHGRLIECRVGLLGSESVYVDGTARSERPFAGLEKAIGGVKGHELVIKDENGVDRAVEVRVESGTWAPRVRVLVDGRDRALVGPANLKKPPACCANCGYTLAGLEVVSGEVKCPECGRHTSAAAVGIT